jgi:hypothetical protein
MTTPAPSGMSPSLWIRTQPGELIRGDQIARLQISDTSGNVLAGPDARYDLNTQVELRAQLLCGGDWITLGSFVGTFSAFDAMDSLLGHIVPRTALRVLSLNTSASRQQPWTITPDL